MTDPMSDKWDAALEDMRRMSDMLKGFVTILTDEGWTEEQAKTLVVAAFVSQSRGTR